MNDSARYEVVQHIVVGGGRLFVSVFKTRCTHEFSILFRIVQSHL